MGKDGIAYLFVCPDQGEPLTAIENLINKVIPAMRVEGFEVARAVHRARRPASSSTRPSRGRTIWRCAEIRLGRGNLPEGLKKLPGRVDQLLCIAQVRDRPRTGPGRSGPARGPRGLPALAIVSARRRRPWPRRASRRPAVVPRRLEHTR